jgi:hypothetical protein
MNRRSFLTFLGLTPVVAAVPASAAAPVKFHNGGVIQANSWHPSVMKWTFVGEAGPEMVLPLSPDEFGITDSRLLKMREVTRERAEAFSREVAAILDDLKKIDTADVASAA